MSDLLARIRAKLAGFDNEACYGGGCGCESRCDVSGFEEMKAALAVVLELHAYPAGSGIPGEVHCGELIDWVSGGCPTVLLIAEKLGIEAVDD